MFSVMARWREEFFSYVVPKSTKLTDLSPGLLRVYIFYLNMSENDRTWAWAIHLKTLKCHKYVEPLYRRWF